MLKKVIFAVFIIAVFFSLVYLSADVILKLQPKQVTKYFPDRMIEKKSSINYSQPSYTGEMQFYPNMRFQENQVSFSIDENCDAGKIEKIYQAMEILANKTALSFFLSSEPQIYFSCLEKPAEDSSDEYYIAGEGGIKSAVNTGMFYLIEKGEVLLFYKKNDCNSANVEIHELLHVLGFKHSGNPESIMYNVSFCSQILTDDITERINELYETEALPELKIENIKAVKHSIYIDFKIEIKNQGLASSSSNLEIYSGNELIKTFDMGALDYGEAKVLTVENLYSGLSKSFKFEVKGDKELDFTNNEASVSFEE